MLRKLLTLVPLLFAVFLLYGARPVSAADQWFYTSPDGYEFYLRRPDGARAWRGGHVVRVGRTGETDSFFYFIEPFRDIPYKVYNGDDYRGTVIEKGTINGSDYGAFKSSVRSLYEMLF